ncbi:MAG TPA: M48 family metalloprotease [Terriglobales bacterium]|nr:M48 family metalloprotease [Terriglobales bacterium]
MTYKASFSFYFILLWSVGLGLAQQCPQAPVLSPSKELNLFSEEQEFELGEIAAAQLSYDLHVIEDDALAGRLKQIGDRLLTQMPPSRARFRFYLLDSSSANAFALPGGRIYVNRKLITTVRSEDELAGVVAHEMGHQLVHHSALQWSQIFHDAFGTTKLGDRADIEDKFHQALDVYRTKRGIFAHAFRGERAQIEADQVAVYAVSRSGYAPQAWVDFWDRLTESQGRKGSWISDLFGTTRPDSKRLREIIKSLGAIPASCIASTTHSPSADFERWQTAVRNYTGFGKKESLHKVVMRRRLEPVLREDIRLFRFSPDGKYLLAQDDTSIFVLTRDPLALLFRIDARRAHDAQFSPDSRSVVFYSHGLRVERWNISEQRLEDIDEVYVFQGCEQSALSPDGRYLACIRANRDTYFPLDLLLFDVDTGDPVFTKKGFIGPTGVYQIYSAIFVSWSSRRPLAAMAFSPDGRYLLVGRPEVHLLLDMKSLAEISVPGTVRKVTSATFAFVGPERIVGANSDNLEQASLVRFPSGEIISSDIPIGGRVLSPVSKGSYVLVRPLQKAPVGLMDLETKKIFMASRTNALDIYEKTFVNERANGEIGLYTQAGERPIATVALPLSPLARLSSAAVAPGLNAIALSERTRGALWDLNSGERLLYIRGFRGAYFEGGNVFFNFAPLDLSTLRVLKGQSEKEVRRLRAEEPGNSLARADLGTRSIVPIREMKRRVHVRHFGSVVLTWTPEDDDKPRNNITLEAHDSRTDALLWSRYYPKAFPGIEGALGSDTAVFAWELGTRGAKDELKDDPEAKKMVNAVKENEGSYLVEVVDLRTGKARAKFPIETGHGSFQARAFYAAGSTLLMLDDQQRVLLYSLKGVRLGRLFGGDAGLSPDGSKVVVEREPGRLAVYDVAGLRQRDELTFGARVSFADFSPDGKRLIVLTDDQTVFVLDVDKTAN